MGVHSGQARRQSSSQSSETTDGWAPAEIRDDIGGEDVAQGGETLAVDDEGVEHAYVADLDEIVGVLMAGGSMEDTGQVFC